jgi:phosphoesterase RecJ-like protein
MDRYLYTQVFTRLLASEQPLFIADERIDGDSLGSSLALADHLLRLRKPVRVFVSGPVPEKYQFLPHVEICTHDPDVLRDPDTDLVVSFDCSDAAYVSLLIAQMPRRPFIINIDHHASNPRYGDLSMVDTASPATCEMVYRLFRANQCVLNRESATCLLCGICFDTTIFFNGATNVQALAAASDLVRCGASIQDVIRAVFRNRRVAALNMWGVALERLRYHSGLGLVTTAITREDMDAHGVTDEEIDGLSDFLNVVIRVETLCVLRETHGGGVKVSMRTTSRNVAGVASTFGGGGHRKAAGFTVPHSRLVCDASGCWHVEECEVK